MGINTHASSFSRNGNRIPLMNSASKKERQKGTISAVFSFLRTFVFKLSTVLLLSKLLGLNDIWRAKAVAEVVSFLASFSFIAANRKRQAVCQEYS